MKSELASLKSSYNSLVLTSQENEKIIQKLRKTIKEWDISRHKADSVSNMQSRVNLLLEEKTKALFDIEKLQKLNKELAAKSEGYKKMTDYNEDINQKRDLQLETVLGKFNHLKSENSNLKNELFKKGTIISAMHNELVELRQYRDIKAISEKQNRFIEELKKIIENKDVEISMLKSVVKSMQSTFAYLQ